MSAIALPTYKIKIGSLKLAVGIKRWSKNVRHHRCPIMSRHLFKLRDVSGTLLVVLSSIAGAHAQGTAAYLQSPQVQFKDLFSQVQSLRAFADSKTFADAIPNVPPNEIMALYDAQGPKSLIELKHFVDAHFTVPQETTPVLSLTATANAAAPLVTHIDILWDSLTRRTLSVPPYSSLLPLPEPYVVPGGRFRELYYWDSYFTMLGLATSGRQDLVESMVRNFAYLIDTYGHVPNGTRTYYLSRSQPPFFFLMVGLLDAKDPARAYAQYLPQLRREYEFWMQGEDGLHRGSAHRRVVALSKNTVLNRYWDDNASPRDESYREDFDLARTARGRTSKLFRDIRAAAESGWDFSSRWFADGHTRATLITTEIVPVDLNSLLYGMEQSIRAGCERQGDQQCVNEFSRRATLRHAAIDHYLWDAKEGTYRDYRWTHASKMPGISAASLYPLFVGLATDVQAAAVAKVTRGELLKMGGIVATTITTGQQWDSPNGWAPLQWIAIEGLRRSGQPSLAATIACRWMSAVIAVYQQSGKLVEKYDVVTAGQSGGGGEYPLQDGFGWTNGVVRKLMAMYPETTAGSCALEQRPMR